VQSVCYGWLIYDITHDPFWLGLISSIGSLPLLGLSLFGGAIADRVDKRRALIYSQGMFVIFAAILGVMVQTHTINRYYILLMAVLQGIVLSIDQPIRQVMPASLVPKKDLVNAIMLNSAAFNAARIVGPSIGGILAATLGMASCFYLNSASFVAVIIALTMMKMEFSKVPANGKPLIADMVDGLRYIRKESRIFKLMIMLTISSLFVMPYITLIPVFARDILRQDIKGNGSLLTSIGIGAVIGALLMVKLSHVPKKGRILLASSALGAVFLIIFANSKTLELSQLVLIGMGLCALSFNQTANSLIQYLSDDAYRGRVASAYVFVLLGLSPLANLQAGFLAKTIGAPITVTIWGIILLCLAVYIATRRDIIDL
jgi:MFS family permease